MRHIVTVISEHQCQLTGNGIVRGLDKCRWRKSTFAILVNRAQKLERIPNTAKSRSHGDGIAIFQSGFLQARLPSCYAHFKRAAHSS